jgi:SAM-dependent methyltransferase
MRGFWRANTALTHLGERHRIEWLTYNPLQMHAYHLLAREAAPHATRAMEEVFPTAERYADVGAGSGTFAAELLRLGKHVEACERSRIGRLYARRQGARCVPLDLRRPRPARLIGPFDLGYCFEVAEHISPRLGDRLVWFVCSLAPIVVFSAAQPGQGGLAHINEQEPEYWISRFARYDYRHDQDLTHRLRHTLRARGATETWLLTNTMVFTQNGELDRPVDC